VKEVVLQQIPRISIVEPPGVCGHIPHGENERKTQSRHSGAIAHYDQPHQGQAKTVEDHGWNGEVLLEEGEMHEGQQDPASELHQMLGTPAHNERQSSSCSVDAACHRLLVLHMQ